MYLSAPSLAALSTLFISIAQAQLDPALVGTWTTKSKKVVTGPAFYNPVDDKFTEPDLPGISYSFTADGWYEEAYYRAISNPQQPACPSGIMQWQHGKYTMPGNGSILFHPIGVDGRQLTSSPCSYTSSLYVRYYQPELMSKYAVYKDPYHGVQRLDLYEFDGKPMNPMFLQYTPPQMLPTQTLNPTSTATGRATKRTDEPLRKRGTGGHFDGEQYHIKAEDVLPSSQHDGLFDLEKLKWFSWVMIVGGGIMWVVSR